MQVFISNFSHNNINSNFQYMKMFSNNYAANLSKNIYLCIDLLKEFPYIGRYIPEISDKSYKERIYTNYRIVYQTLKKLQLVYIHFIVHSKMDFLAYYKLYKKNMT